MTIKVTVEGGGSFELAESDEKALRTRLTGMTPHAWWQVIDALAAALPPEPYQPKEGDRVRYRLPDWPPGRLTDWESHYLGQWRDWHVVVAMPEELLCEPSLVHASAEFRPVDL